MKECDQLIVAASPNRRTGEPEFQEGDEIVLTATFIPGDKCCVEQYQSAREAFGKERQCDEKWLKEHFDYHAEIRKGNAGKPHHPPLIKARITKKNNITFIWKWDTSGYPPGSYTARVCVEEKDDELRHSSGAPESYSSEEFLAVKKVEDMQ